jgi:Ca-activated chloride channel family protein
MNGPSNLRALAATAVSAVIVVTTLGLTAYQARQLALAPKQLGLGQVLTTGAPSGGNCLGLVLSVPPDDVPAIGSLVGLYDGSHRTVDGQCVDARISPKSAGETADALITGWDPNLDGPQPDVWLPGASSWLVLVRGRAEPGQASVIPEANPSFAESPMVIAMPRPMAEALGWPQKPIGFSDLVAIGTDPAGWGKVGHPEWGPLKLGKTSPLVSTPGLHALIATYFAATGVSSDLLVSDLSQPQTQAFAKGVELATVHYGESATAFLTSLQAADAAGDGLGYVSAVAVEEHQVLDYNLGNPSGATCCNGKHTPPTYPLAAIYPKEGTLISDNPFVVLKEDWVTAAKQAVAADLLSFLMEPAQQQRLQSLGYRDAQGRPGAVLDEAGGFIPAGPAKVINPPSAPVLAAVQASWWSIRKPARVLIIVDVSGSMDSPAMPGVSKLNLVKTALGAALDQVGDSDEIGLWTFSNLHQEVVPITPVKDGRDKLKAGVAAMSSSGGTQLYKTVQDGLAYMQQRIDAQHITAIVVLTDGQDTSSPDNALNDLLNSESHQPPNQSVKVFTIGYGADADQAVLARIASASGGGSYDASNPALIRRVFNAVLSNF